MESLKLYSHQVATSDGEEILKALKVCLPLSYFSKITHKYYRNYVTEQYNLFNFLSVPKQQVRITSRKMTSRIIFYGQTLQNPMAFEEISSTISVWRDSEKDFGCDSSSLLQILDERINKGVKGTTTILNNTYPSQSPLLIYN